MPSIKAKLLAALLAPALLTACLGEEKPKCMPNPTLKCVTDAAAQALHAATATHDHRVFITYSDILPVALAQKKLGEAAALDTTISLIKDSVAASKRTVGAVSPSLLSWDIARIMAALGRTEEARPAILKFVLDDEKLTTADAPYFGVTPSLQDYVSGLLDAGLVDEARALIARQRERLEKARAEMKPEYRVNVLRSLLAAYHRLGDEAGRAAMINALLVQMREMPVIKDGVDDERAGLFNITSAQEVADTLLGWKLGPMAEPFMLIANEHMSRKLATGEKAAMANPHYGDKLLASRRRLELKWALIKGEAELIRASRKGMIEGKADFETGNSPAWIAENLLADMKSAASLKDKETVAGLAARAKALAERWAAEKSGSDLAQQHLAEALAIAGDEAAMNAALARVADDPKDWKFPKIVSDACIALATNGHVEPALRCAARLDGMKRPFWEFRALRTYGAIATTLAR